MILDDRSASELDAHLYPGHEDLAWPQQHEDEEGHAGLGGEGEQRGEEEDGGEGGEFEEGMEEEEDEDEGEEDDAVEEGEEEEEEEAEEEEELCVDAMFSYVRKGEGKHAGYMHALLCWGCAEFCHFLTLYRSHDAAPPARAGRLVNVLLANVAVKRDSNFEAEPPEYSSNNASRQAL